MLKRKRKSWSSIGEEGKENARNKNECTDYYNPTVVF